MSDHPLVTVKPVEDPRERELKQHMRKVVVADFHRGIKAWQDAASKPSSPYRTEEEFAEAYRKSTEQIREYVSPSFKPNKLLSNLLNPNVTKWTGKT